MNFSTLHWSLLSYLFHPPLIAPVNHLPNSRDTSPPETLLPWALPQMPCPFLREWQGEKWYSSPHWQLKTNPLRKKRQVGGKSEIMGLKVRYMEEPRSLETAWHYLVSLTYTNPQTLQFHQKIYALGKMYAHVWVHGSSFRNQKLETIQMFTKEQINCTIFIHWNMMLLEKLRN